MLRSKSFIALIMLLVVSIFSAGAVWWFTRRDVTYWGNELNKENGYWLHPTNEHLTDFWYLDNYSGKITRIERESEFSPPHEIDIQLATVGLQGDFVDRQVTLRFPPKTLDASFVVIDPNEVPPTLSLDFGTWVEYIRLNADISIQVAKSAGTGDTFVSGAILVLPIIESNETT
jgi:hypothetical protein